ncbi:hypothetical protein P692DRAFT_20827097, partial [Suillus brevipes Sb2]
MPRPCKFGIFLLYFASFVIGPVCGHLRCRARGKRRTGLLWCTWNLARAIMILRSNSVQDFHEQLT